MYIGFGYIFEIFNFIHGRHSAAIIGFTCPDNIHHVDLRYSMAAVKNYVSIGKRCKTPFTRYNQLYNRSDNGLVQQEHVCICKVK